MLGIHPAMPSRSVFFFVKRCLLWIQSPYLLLAHSGFLFLLDSELVGCVFPGMYLLYPGGSAC